MKQKVILNVTENVFNLLKNHLNQNSNLKAGNLKCNPSQAINSHENAEI